MRAKMLGNYSKIRLTVEEGIDTLDRYDGHAGTLDDMRNGRLSSGVFAAALDKRI